MRRRGFRRRRLAWPYNIRPPVETIRHALLRDSRGVAASARLERHLAFPRRPGRGAAMTARMIQIVPRRPAAIFVIQDRGDGLWLALAGETRLGFCRKKRGDQRSALACA